MGLIVGCVLVVSRVIGLIVVNSVDLFNSLKLK